MIECENARMRECENARMLMIQFDSFQYKLPCACPFIQQYRQPRKRGGEIATEGLNIRKYARCEWKCFSFIRPMKFATKQRVETHGRASLQGT